RMEDVKTQAEKMDGWSLENEIVVRRFNFAKYVDGVSFAEKIGIYAVSAQHHPFISIDYTAVTVSWTTHSKTSLTEKDIAAARACNNLYRSFTCSEKPFRIWNSRTAINIPQASGKCRPWGAIRRRAVDGDHFLFGGM